MVRLPDSRPGLAKVADAAADRRGGQPDRRAAGKFEIDRPTGAAEPQAEHRADRQQRQNAVLLAAMKAPVNHAVDLVEGDPAKGPLERPTRPLADRAALPAKTVGDVHEDSRVAIVGEVAHRNERVLQTGG